jgi:hypothetical protein
MLKLVTDISSEPLLDAFYKDLLYIALEDDKEEAFTEASQRYMEERSLDVDSLRAPQELSDYLAFLRALPFVHQVEVCKWFYPYA